MEILGVGPSELIFILLIAIIVLGPKDMQKAGKTLGRLLNQINRSNLWKLVTDTSREISDMPKKWMREANMDSWDPDRDLPNMIDPRTRKPVSALTQKPTQPASSDQPDLSSPDSKPADEGAATSTDQHG